MPDPSSSNYKALDEIHLDPEESTEIEGANLLDDAEEDGGVTKVAEWNLGEDDAGTINRGGILSKFYQN